MFPTQMLELLLDELSSEFETPRISKMFTTGELEWIFALYNQIRYNDDKFLIAMHIVSKIILIERKFIK